jgi:hypothetical protein
MDNGLKARGCGLFYGIISTFAHKDWEQPLENLESEWPDSKPKFLLETFVNSECWSKRTSSWDLVWQVALQRVAVLITLIANTLSSSTQGHGMNTVRVPQKALDGFRRNLVSRSTLKLIWLSVVHQYFFIRHKLNFVAPPKNGSS